ncbi:MAG: ABC transporter substrate-binding protein [Rhodobacteraceae bacterium]|nr:MAG: ABC transporter substrate-binding protein [Paracoccaceae bacterium]
MTASHHRLSAALLSSALGLTAVPAFAQDVIWARYGDIDSLDPHRATSTLSLQIWDQIYDTLLAFDMDANPVPNMAESWEASEDGLTYRFTLHEGILCHDGSPFTAEDVRFTIDRAFGETPSLTRTSWGPIESVEVIDDLIFEITLETPFAAFLTFLADPFSSMICSGIDTDTFGSSTAIGTGPFKLVSWARGSEIVLESFDGFRNLGQAAENTGAPGFDRLLVRTIPEAQTRLAALRTGTVHIAEPPFDDIDAIRTEGLLDIVIAENTGQNVFWQFTTSRPPFDDIRARQAVALATDPAMAIEIIYGDLSQREWCPISRGVFGNDQDFCEALGYAHDPARARELVAELGFGPGNPLRTTMLVWTGGNRHMLAEIFQAQLAEANIQAEIEIMDIGTMNARVRAENEDVNNTTPGTFDMMTWSWFDPDILFQLWHSPGAYSGYQSPELDALLQETRTTIEPEARLEAVHAVIEYLMTNAVHIGLYTPGWEWVFAVRPEIEGLQVGPFVRPNFLDVTVAQ